MSLSDILTTAIGGLNASQAGLSTVSNNIANLGVAGYARERVSFSTQASEGRVNGVVVGEPERVADSFLEGEVYRRGGDAGRSEVTADFLDRLQSLLGTPGAEGGLAERLNAIQSAAGAMTGAQQSPQTVSAFTSTVQDALGAMNTLNNDVNNLRGDIETELGQTVDRVNVLLKQIDDLNDEISRSAGHSTSGAENRRASALQELSGLMKVNVRNQPDGRVTIETSTGQMLLDKRLRQLDYPSGPGVSQATYPDIGIRFANDDGSLGASTGDTIDSSAVGGKLGGLIDLRDRALPQVTEQLGQLFSGLADSLNKVSNESTRVPPPQQLVGRPNGLVAGDRLGFTGVATFAVLGSDGTLVNKIDIDFDALNAANPPAATIQNAVDAINAGLSPDATASIAADGTLSIAASATGNGIAIAQDPTDPSSRGGMGFSQFFGLNDVVRSDNSPLVPSGLAATDQHGFTTGETAGLVLRDSTGREIASYTLQPTTGGTMQDVLNDLNGSSMGGFGTFSLDAQGRLLFAPNPGSPGANVSVVSDSTDRAGTGVNFSALFGLSGENSGLSTASVRKDLLDDGTKLPLARLDLTAAIGEKAVGPGDLRGANAFVDQLAGAANFGKDGKATITAFASQLLGNTGADAARAATDSQNSSARLLDAQTRRDNYGGVNIDEELSLMVVLQNSYSAAARVITTTSDMYQTLVNMV